MKRFLIIFFVSVFILSLLCIGVSAEPLVRDDFSSGGASLRAVPDADVGYPYHFVFVSNPSYSSTFAQSISFTCNNITYSSLTWSSSSNSLHFINSGSDLVVYSTANGWSDDSYRYITILEEPYAGMRGFLSANEYNRFPVNVTPAISFVGQVLTFFTSNGAVLSLLGLSVALFFLVPFSIRKFKEFVKGY